MWKKVQGPHGPRFYPQLKWTCPPQDIEPREAIRQIRQAERDAEKAVDQAERNQEAE